jgi:hypothetical protein
MVKFSDNLDWNTLIHSNLVNAQHSSFRQRLTGLVDDAATAASTAFVRIAASTATAATIPAATTAIHVSNSLQITILATVGAFQTANSSSVAARAATTSLSRIGGILGRHTTAAAGADLSLGFRRTKDNQPERQSNNTAEKLNNNKWRHKAAEQRCEDDDP